MSTAPTGTKTVRVITEARLTYEPEQVIRLPAAAQVIGVRTRQGGITLYVTCNPHLPNADRAFCLRRSDEPLPEPAAHYRYVGTIDDTPALHIFEKRA